MRIVHTKSAWEFTSPGSDDPFADFVTRAAGDGFGGLELFLPLLEESPSRVAQAMEAHGLDHLVIDVITEGDNPADHRASFDAAIGRAATYGPALINSHTGRDIFPFHENVALFDHAVAVSESVGIPIVHETHRFRPTYSAIETRRYLEEVPDMLLNADLSHWFVVHESDLRDQDGAIDLALSRSRHIHARVGFEEGPQISHPNDPRWSTQVERHVELWQRIVDHCASAGVETLAITPEFGPFPYVPMQAFSDEPVADPWDANVAMRDLVAERLSV